MTDEGADDVTTRGSRRWEGSDPGEVAAHLQRADELGLEWPNLLVIGAMKAGTSALHSFLRSHPDIGMSDPKELRFFSRREQWLRGPEWYLSHVPQGTLIRGESCPQYSKVEQYPDVARRIADVLGRPRLIYCVREPVSRMVSHWRHLWAEGRERRPFEVAVRDGLPSNRYVDPSRYHHQVSQYLGSWQLSDVEIIEEVDLLRDPRSQLLRIFEWLGVEDRPLATSVERRVHDTARKGPPTALGSVLERVDPRLLRAARSVRPLQRLVRRPVPKPEVSPSLRAELYEILEPDINAFRELTQRELAGWRAR